MTEAYTVQTHPEGFAVHYPSGALKRVFDNEGDAARFAWECEAGRPVFGSHDPADCADDPLIGLIVFVPSKGEWGTVVQPDTSIASGSYWVDLDGGHRRCYLHPREFLV